MRDWWGSSLRWCELFFIVTIIFVDKLTLCCNTFWPQWSRIKTIRLMISVSSTRWHRWQSITGVFVCAAESDSACRAVSQPISRLVGQTSAQVSFSLQWFWCTRAQKRSRLDCHEVGHVTGLLVYIHTACSQLIKQTELQKMRANTKSDILDNKWFFKVFCWNFSKCN